MANVMICKTLLPEDAGQAGVGQYMIEQKQLLVIKSVHLLNATNNYSTSKVSVSAAV